MGTREGLGDEGKAVGCVPPTALLFEALRRRRHDGHRLTLRLIGMMIVGAAFLSLVTEGLLWLEGYVRDQSEFSRLVSIIGPPGEFLV
jgi:hypothetical protein